MDVFSHAIYGYAALRWRGPRSARWGALFGALPDITYSGAALIRRFVRGGWDAIANAPARDVAIWRADGPPLPADLVADYYDFYRYTHSLVILAVVALAWYAIRRRPPWLLFPWVLHILMDIPTHERYETPFLFPLSDLRFVGMSWGRPPLLIANAVVLTALFLWLYRRYWRQLRPGQPWPEQAEGVA